MKLILFDIDGTLLSVDRALSRRVIAATLESGLGFSSDVPEYEYSGKTDRRILFDLATLVGVDPTTARRRLPELQRWLEVHWTAFLDPRHVGLHPGVERLLRYCESREDVRLGLLTGNLAAGAHSKLRAAGIEHYFTVGAYGCDAEDRNDLPPIALRRATERFGYRFAPEHTVVIGDSHRDIRCARAWGMRSLAVTTGRFDRASLQRHRPDAIVESLDDASYVQSFLDEELAPRGCRA